MQNKYPLWKNLLLVFVAIAAFIYALPNFYGEDPSIQISPVKTEDVISTETALLVKKTLEKAKLKPRAFEQNDKQILMRFPNTDTQIQAKDLIRAALDQQKYIIASNFTSAAPSWLAAIGATPMKYGLDLRGGVHLLMEVDIPGVMRRREEALVKNIGTTLREARLRYTSLRRTMSNRIIIQFRTTQTRDAAFKEIRSNFPQLLLNKVKAPRGFGIIAKLSPAEVTNIRQYTIEQTMTTLRNRVNELGIGEAIVQQQGTNRVAVDLPGIQDAARAKKILRGTATLEFHLVDTKNDAPTAAMTGIVPVGSRLYTHEGRPVLLYNQVILSGGSITSATSTIDESGMPAVIVSLGGGGESLFTKTTRENVGKPMSIVFVETKVDSKLVDGQVKRKTRKVERVINVATIQSALGNRFRITGLSSMEEARDLALFLRAGALPATIFPVEERIVGPTLGIENIKRGLISLAVGTAIIFVVMLLYYQLFGLIADIALLLNLVLLVAILSLLDAVLTLPGIAGVVLTMGMAVDANVLIYERIREELRHGMGAQAAIFAGYERAFSTIVDANVTTLIVVVILFAIGTGPIKSFAITTSVGLLASMITGITFTRAMVNLIYGRRQVKHLAIGTVRVTGHHAKPDKA